MAADAPGLTSSHRAGKMAKRTFLHSVLFLVSNLRKSWQTSYISLTRAESHAHSWTLTGKEEQDDQGWHRPSIIYPLSLGERVWLHTARCLNNVRFLSPRLGQMTRGILVPQLEIKPVSRALEACSFNPCITREVSMSILITLTKMGQAGWKVI